MGRWIIFISQLFDKNLKINMVVEIKDRQVVRVYKSNIIFDIKD